VTGASTQRSEVEEAWVDVLVLKDQSYHRHRSNSGIGGFHVLPQHVHSTLLRIDTEWAVSSSLIFSDHHTQHMPVCKGSTDIYDFLIDWHGEHLAHRVSLLLPVLAKLLRGSAVSACVKFQGNVYDFLISYHISD
jgi:hypothetical protein